LALVTVPADVSDEIRTEGLSRRGGFGSVRVEATIGVVIWRTSVFPQKAAAICFPSKRTFGGVPKSLPAKTSI
jgi:Domain of unknown function (DUF1905)